MIQLKIYYKNEGHFMKMGPTIYDPNKNCDRKCLIRCSNEILHHVMLRKQVATGSSENLN